MLTRTHLQCLPLELIPIDALKKAMRRHRVTPSVAQAFLLLGLSHVTSHKVRVEISLEGVSCQPKLSPRPHESNGPSMAGESTNNNTRCVRCQGPRRADTRNYTRQEVASVSRKHNSIGRLQHSPVGGL